MSTQKNPTQDQTENFSKKVSFDGLTQTVVSDSISRKEINQFFEFRKKVTKIYYDPVLKQLCYRGKSNQSIPIAKIVLNSKTTNMKVVYKDKNEYNISSDNIEIDDSNCKESSIILSKTEEKDTVKKPKFNNANINKILDEYLNQEKLEKIKKIKGHVNKKGCHAGIERNRYWLVDTIPKSKEFYIMITDNFTFFKFSKESLDKVLKLGEIKNPTWYVGTNGYVMAHVNDTLRCLHQHLMDHYGKGKGTKNGSVDHINMEQLDNRLENLRIVDDKTQQNNKGKKERTGENSLKIDNDLIPTGIHYCAADKKTGHGESFEVCLESLDRKRSTRSTKVPLPEKLIEAIRLRYSLIEKDKSYLKKVNLDGVKYDCFAVFTKRQKDVIQKICKVEGITCKPEWVDFADADVSLVDLSKTKQSGIPAHMIPKYIQYIKPTKTRGDGYDIEVPGTSMRKSTNKKKDIPTYEKLIDAIKIKTEILKQNPQCVPSGSFDQFKQTQIDLIKQICTHQKVTCKKEYLDFSIVDLNSNQKLKGGSSGIPNNLIPSGICYNTSDKSHGDKFTIRITGYPQMSSTTSRKVSTAEKLIEAIRLRTGIFKKHPTLITSNQSFDEFVETQKELIKQICQNQKISCNKEFLDFSNI